ncbi:hypothetical protein ABT009_02370 [Streptomyces sp. NPDC002896]|uniref:hypothetical protein n=1 Tax=Streptomyces sp. NPDC002896 TaxID=3154438 RepID=UPI00332221A6
MRGIATTGIKRTHTHSTLRDAFSLDLRHEPWHKSLYLDTEHFHNYRRDQDVFDPGITIEDNLSLIVDYASGASMTYALNAHSPWEGYVNGVNGTKGRAELTVVERGSVTTDADGRVITDLSASPRTGRRRQRATRGRTARGAVALREGP